MSDKPIYMGLATLKEEGNEAPFDPAFKETPEQAIARKAAADRRWAAYKEFRKHVKRLPKVLTPAWLGARYALAEESGERDQITYLRRLVLWRMASGKIEHPQECAAIVMPEGETPYEEG